MQLDTPEAKATPVTQAARAQQVMQDHLAKTVTQVAKATLDLDSLLQNHTCQWRH